MSLEFLSPSIQTKYVTHQDRWLQPRYLLECIAVLHVLGLKFRHF
jgi:hypothetical protein